MNETENILFLKEKIIKIRNSKSKYIEIPREFEELSDGDITKMIKKIESKTELHVVFVFEKKNLKIQKEEL